MSTQYKILVGDTATPQARVPEIGSETYLAPISLTDATGDEVAFEINYITNKLTSGNDTGFLINQTDTLSPGTSLLQDWQVGGISQVSLDNVGQLRMDKALTYGVTTGIVFGDGDTGIYEYGDDDLRIRTGGTDRIKITWNYFGSSNAQKATIRHDIAPTDIAPVFLPHGSNDADTGIGWRVANVGVLIGGAQNCLEFGGVGAVPELGFYGTAAIAKQTGVAITAAGIHSALVSLGLIAA